MVNHNYVSKRLFLIISSAIAAVALGALLALRQQSANLTSSQPEHPAPTPPLIGETLSGRVVLSTTSPLPSTGEPAVGKKRIPSQSDLDNIATVLGFVSSEKVNTGQLQQNQKIWSSKIHFLTISQDTNLLQFGTYLQSNPQVIQGELPSLSEARQAASEWLKQLGVYTYTSASSSIVMSYYQFGGEHPTETNDPSQAQAIKVDIYPSVDGLRVFGVKPSEAPASIIVGPDNKVIAAIVYLGITSILPGEAVPLKSPQSIQKSLLDDGRIVSIEEKEGDVTPEVLTVYERIDISAISLGYTWQSNNADVELVFILEGRATRIQGEPVGITILLAAEE